MKKSYIVLILMLLTAAVFCSCATEDFSSTLSCKELSSTLESEFSPDKMEFSRYTDEELKFLFPDSDVYNEAIVIYSTDSYNICKAETTGVRLKLYDEVIIKGKNLYDGKIIS